MKANLVHEVLLLSIIILALSILSLFYLFELSPELYDHITGKVTVRSTVNITQRAPANCNTTLANNMNLVSFFCMGDFEDITTAFGSLTNFKAVWSYDPSSSDPWKVYNPNLPSGIVNDLTFLTKRQGYWIRMTGPEAFNFPGGLATPVDIAISSGYQLVGYPTNRTKQINESIENISGSFSQIVGFNSPTQSFRFYIPGVTENLNFTNPYNGYWINGTASDTWVVN